ncbi:metal-dependent hydrolase [Haloplanus salilacus]|uniref:metal-dependent hydrolase n=1 Tax=Haloplanus salilacus TaxID=2949994 RepID=UPI003CCE373E
MPDLLTHILIAYVLGTLVNNKTDLLNGRHVPVLMIGGALPDLSKLYLIVESDVIEQAFSVPFSWGGAHTFGVTLLLSLAGTQLFHRKERYPVFVSLSIGFVLHFILDSFVIRADGQVPPYLFPVSWWQYPSGNLYLSSTFWPSLLSILLATIVFVSTHTAES